MKERMVNVVPGAFSTMCHVHGKRQRCGRKPKFMVFNGDGLPKSSRLDSSCCEKHLARAVKLAHQENQEYWIEFRAMVAEAAKLAQRHSLAIVSVPGTNDKVVQAINAKGVVAETDSWPKMIDILKAKV